MPAPSEVAALVRRWARAAEAVRPDPLAAHLERLLRDADGREFARRFADRVIRPDDPRVAAVELERISRHLPSAIPAVLRAAMTAGGGFGVLLPRPVIPIVRRVFARVARPVLLDGSSRALDRTLGRLRRPRVRIEASVAGGAVLGEKEAARRFADVAGLLDRPDVDGVALTVRSVTGPLPAWDLEAAVARGVDVLAPLFERAAAAKKLVTLDVEEYRDLELSIAVLTRLLARRELQFFEAGIALPAAYPDSLPALQRLLGWARDRVVAGGAGLTVRLATGAAPATEAVDAAEHDWPLATWANRTEVDAHAARMLDVAFHPEHTDAVRIAVAGHDPFLLAFAHLLAESRGVSRRVRFELPAGLARPLVDAVHADVDGVSLAVPVAPPGEFGSAASAVAHRLAGGAAEPPIADLTDPVLVARAGERITAALSVVRESAPATLRVQDRSRPALPRAPRVFANDPVTDPAVPGNRAWARSVLERAASTEAGLATVEASRVAGAEDVATRVAAAVRAGTEWGRRPVAERADALDRVGEVLSAYRGRLAEIAVAETGATLADADADVSRAVDAAYDAASRARELDGIRGAEFEPVALTVVASPRVAPVAHAARQVFAALAAGSAVLLSPSPRAPRSAAVFAEALAEGGVPGDLYGLVVAADDDARRALITAPEAGRVLLTGAIETAAEFASWRADLPLLAATSGKNAIVVTPSADLDAAVRDLVSSAFGRSGQDCAAASLAILVGSVAGSERFRRQLDDAVRSLAVGWPADPGVQVGPVVEAVQGKLARGLTRLADGESWLVKPRQLDDTDRLWSPGVRDGVRPGSDFHRTEFLGPVLGLMAVATLDEAIELQNSLATGLAAGIHSLDPAEIAVWLERTEAGMLAVNRPLTGAVARRQPVGGWKRSAVGPGAAWGGASTLLPLGGWRPVPDTPGDDLGLDGLDERVQVAIEAFQPVLDFDGYDRVRRAAFDDERAWSTEFGVDRDPGDAEIVRHVVRYRPAEVVIRGAEGADPADLARVLVAGVRARARMLVSTATPLPAGLLPYVDDGTPLGRSLLGILGVTVESDAAFQARVARGLPARIRLVGGSVSELRAATGGSVDVAVWGGPVTGAGRIELLPFLKEQSVSISAHRFGVPDRDLATLPVG